MVNAWCFLELELIGDDFLNKTGLAHIQKFKNTLQKKKKFKNDVL